MEVCKEILGKGYRIYYNISLQVFNWLQTYWNMGLIV